MVHTKDVLHGETEKVPGWSPIWNSRGLVVLNLMVLWTQVQWQL